VLDLVLGGCDLPDCGVCLAISSVHLAVSGPGLFDTRDRLEDRTYEETERHLSDEVRADCRIWTDQQQNDEGL
jgi:hypothetical protein